MDHLDFSGGPKSWFDLWHYHPTEQKHCKLSLEKQINILITEFRKLQQRLSEYQNPYQTWILLDVNSCIENAVYIHTENPNGSPFPINFTDEAEETKDKAIRKYIEDLGYRSFSQMHEDGPLIFIYDENVGLPIL